MKEQADKLASTIASAIIPAHNNKDRARQADLAERISADLIAFAAGPVAPVTTQENQDHESHDHD